MDVVYYVSKMMSLLFNRCHRHHTDTSSALSFAYEMYLISCWFPYTLNGYFPICLSSMSVCIHYFSIFDWIDLVKHDVNACRNVANSRFSSFGRLTCWRFFENVITSFEPIVAHSIDKLSNDVLRRICAWNRYSNEYYSSGTLLHY